MSLENLEQRFEVLEIIMKRWVLEKGNPPLPPNAVPN